MRSVNVVVVVVLAGCCYASPVPIAEDAPPALDLIESAPPVIEPVVIDPPPPPAPVVVRELEGHLSEASWAALARGLAPQAPDARGLWDRAAPIDGPIERSVLVCRARVRGAGFDDSFFAGGADVSLAVRVGDGDVRRTPQTPARVYTFPVARLVRGDTVWVRAIDDDVFFDDTIAEGSVGYTHAPFALTMGQADVECGALPSALVDARAASSIATLARAIERLEVGDPDVTAHDLGYPRARTAPVLTAAQEAAAWLEWSDPAMIAQRDRAVAFELAWQESAERAVERAVESAPPPGTPVELGRGRRLTVGEVRCDRAADALLDEIGGDARVYRGRCVVPLTVECGASRLRLAPLSTRPPVPFEAWGLDARGRMIALELVARRDASGWIPPGEDRAIEAGATGEIVIALPYRAQVALLRVRDAPSRARVLRVD